MALMDNFCSTPLSCIESVNVPPSGLTNVASADLQNSMNFASEVEAPSLDAAGPFVSLSTPDNADGSSRLIAALLSEIILILPTAQSELRSNPTLKDLLPLTICLQ